MVTSKRQVAEHSVLSVYARMKQRKGICRASDKAGKLLCKSSQLVMWVDADLPSVCAYAFNHYKLLWCDVKKSHERQMAMHIAEIAFVA